MKQDAAYPGPRRLYHGTLSRNIDAIREQGLQPRPGLVTAAYHDGAANFVCAADEDHKGGLTRIIIQQMVHAHLIHWSEDYSLDDFKRDLSDYVTIVIVDAERFSYCADMSRCPKGVETGDWYSCEPVLIEAELNGQAMIDLLPLSETNFRHDYFEFLRRLTTAETQQ